MNQITITLNIYAEPDVQTVEEATREASYLCEQVAKQIREGFTSGAYPAWDLTITQ